MLGYLDYRPAIPILLELKRLEKRRFKRWLEEVAYDSDEDKENKTLTWGLSYTEDHSRCRSFNLALALMGYMDYLSLWHVSPKKAFKRKKVQYPERQAGHSGIIIFDSWMVDAAMTAVCRDKGRYKLFPFVVIIL